jgi:hypothetical protein
MARLVDSDRHDAHTARTFARSIAGRATMADSTKFTLKGYLM